MQTLKSFRKEMMEHAKYVDLDEGETRKDWVDTLLMAIKEEGRIVKIGRMTYVKDINE